MASALVATTLLASCIGTTSRSEFRAEVESRGGGLTVALVRDAIGAVAEVVGTPEFAVTFMTVSPVDSTVSMVVRDPRQPENLDSYAIRNGRIGSVAPVVVDPDDDLDASTLPIAAIPLDRIEEIGDRALAELGPGAHVSSVYVGGAAGAAQIAVSVETDRARATVYFSVDGTLERVDR